MGVAPAIDLTAGQRRTVLALLNRHLPNTIVWAYGSRVKWTSHPASDLDLVAFAKPEQSPRVSELREAFDESNLPFRVDLFVWDDVPESFRKRIETAHVVLARKERSVCNEWPMVTLGTCASLVGDKVAPADCGDLPYIGLEHIGQGTLSLLGTGTAQDVESTKTAFRAGDILFGKLRPYFRKVVRAYFDGICSTDIWVVRPRSEVDAAYLFYLLASKLLIDFANQGTEGTRMPRAKWEQVSRFPVRLPPISEQCAIAQVLGTLDDKIELNRRTGETLEGAISALFKSWFVDFDPVRAKANGRGAKFGWPQEAADLFPKKVDCRTGIPMRWRWWRLDELAALSRVSVSPFRHPEATFEHYSIPAYDAGRQPVVENGSRIRSNKTLIPKGAVLVSKLNPSIPRVWVPDCRGNVTKITSTEFLVFVPKAGLGRGLLSIILSDSTFQQKLQSMATGTSRSHQRVSPSDVVGLECVTGEPEVFAAFDSFVGPLVEHQVLKRRESRTLASLRDTLLPKLLSGEIRIRDAEKIAETAT